MRQRQPTDTDLQGTTVDMKVRNKQTAHVAYDQRATLRALEESLASLRKEGNLDGLAQLHAVADALADTTTGRLSRSAERVAEKASAAVTSLRRKGAETGEERRTREAREAHQASERAREVRTKLLERSTSFLQLALNNGVPATDDAGGTPSDGVAVFRRLAIADGDGHLRIEIGQFFDSWSRLLVESYERSCALFANVSTGVPTDQRRDVECALKAIAVDLMATGADVRGLTSDAIPLLAYAVFNERLPISPSTTSFDTAEQINNLLLSVADEVSAIPIRTRPILIGLFRLSVLLGEAQAYADQLSLTSLALS
jgi:hypothetical protein